MLKSHCELVGEGIEYSWGCAKNFHRQQPTKEKRKKENFGNMVRTFISQQVLTVERVRIFSRRARECIQAYRMLHE
jgi:hypothetical protein